MANSKMVHAKIDGQKFVKELTAKSGKNITQLSAEVFHEPHLLSNAKIRNSLEESVFNYFCEAYKLDKYDYILTEKNETHSESQNEIAIENAINSINKTLFEINKTLKNINDSISRLNGYSANINANTSETKIAVKDLIKSFN